MSTCLISHTSVYQIACLYVHLGWKENRHRSLHGRLVQYSYYYYVLKARIAGYLFFFFFSPLASFFGGCVVAEIKWNEMDLVVVVVWRGSRLFLS